MSDYNNATFYIDVCIIQYRMETEVENLNLLMQRVEDYLAVEEKDLVDIQSALMHVNGLLVMMLFRYLFNDTNIDFTGHPWWL